MNKLDITAIVAAIAVTLSTGAMAEADTHAAAPATITQSPGAYASDSVITGKIKAKVLGDSSLKSAEINVETYQGIVQLTGFVNSRSDIRKAVRIARNVKGVTSVKNDMVVKGKQ